MEITVQTMFMQFVALGLLTSLGYFYINRRNSNV